MKEINVKEEVVAGYSKIAKLSNRSVFSSLFGCCDMSDTAKTIAKTIGYSQEDLEGVPDQSNLGVGCGNPAALTTISEGETVVDLGSGAGFDAFIIAKQVGESGKVIGVDLSEAMLALARKNAKKGNYVNTEFVKGDIEALPLAEGIADHVVSNCVINLSQHKTNVYSEAYRVLRPGGRLAISDIVLEQELPDFIKKSLAGHMACVSGAEPVEQYLSYIERAGFRGMQVVSKSAFPLELMLTDPQLMKLAGEFDFDLDSKEAKDIASRVVSISITARK